MKYKAIKTIFLLGLYSFLLVGCSDKNTDVSTQTIKTTIKHKVQHKKHFSDIEKLRNYTQKVHKQPYVTKGNMTKIKYLYNKVVANDLTNVLNYVWLPSNKQAQKRSDVIYDLVAPFNHARVVNNNDGRLYTARILEQGVFIDEIEYTPVYSKNAVSIDKTWQKEHRKK